jgi:hypothetical protein
MLAFVNKCWKFECWKSGSLENCEFLQGNSLATTWDKAHCLTRPIWWSMGFQSDSRTIGCLIVAFCCCCTLPPLPVTPDRNVCPLDIWLLCRPKCLDLSLKTHYELLVKQGVCVWVWRYVKRRTKSGADQNEPEGVVQKCAKCCSNVVIIHQSFNWDQAILFACQHHEQTLTQRPRSWPWARPQLFACLLQVAKVGTSYT